MTALGLGCVLLAIAQGGAQPVVQPGPSEPDLLVILDRRHGIAMLPDLANPVRNGGSVAPGLFKKAGPGPVTYAPEVALGLEVTIRGGYYVPGAAPLGARRELWSYRHKSTSIDLEEGKPLAPPLSPGSKTEFDPGDQPFGLFVANDQFQDAVFTEPGAVAAHNPRLRAQPYKAMIYAYRDPATKQVVPRSYLICWEYSTNDDFQDVMCRIDNVDLVAADARPLGVKGK